VQEAKETPIVKVLDAASLPERKSFPSRAADGAAGRVSGGRRGGMSVVARSNWSARIRQDPGKVFAARSAADGASADALGGAQWFARQAATHKVWLRLVRRGETRSLRISPQISRKLWKNKEVSWQLALWLTGRSCLRTFQELS